MEHEQPRYIVFFIMQIFYSSVECCVACDINATPSNTFPFIFVGSRIQHIDDIYIYMYIHIQTYIYIYIFFFQDVLANRFIYIFSTSWICNKFYSYVYTTRLRVFFFASNRKCLTLKRLVCFSLLCLSPGRPLFRWKFFFARTANEYRTSRF